MIDKSQRDQHEFKMGKYVSVILCRKERNLFNSSESQNQKNVCSTTKNPEQELSKIQHDTFFWMHNSIIPAIRNFEPTHEPLFPEF